MCFRSVDIYSASVRKAQRFPARFDYLFPLTRGLAVLLLKPSIRTGGPVRILEGLLQRADLLKRTRNQEDSDCRRSFGPRAWRDKVRRPFERPRKVRYFKLTDYHRIDRSDFPAES